MNNSKMQEEEYVETSDVEELGDVYGPGRTPAYDGDVRMDWVRGRALASEGNPQECEMPRKRRKVRGIIQIWNYIEVWLAQPSCW